MFSKYKIEEKRNVYDPNNSSYVVYTRDFLRWIDPLAFTTFRDAENYVKSHFYSTKNKWYYP